MIYIAGYPRSGNTFVEVILNRVFKGIVVSSHDHSIEYLLNRVGHNLVVPVRNPLDSISSWITFRKHEGVLLTIENCINNYIEYLEAIYKNINKVCVLDFDKFKEDISYVTNKVSKHYGNIVDKNITMEKIDNEMKNHYQMFFRGRTLAKADNQLKNEILKHEKYKEAQASFERVINVQN